MAKHVVVSDQKLVLATEEDLQKISAGSIPGGFSKLFNSVIDSGAFARLPVPGQRVYVVMARLANHDRTGRFVFNASVGQIAEAIGSNRRTAIDGTKSLIENMLLAVVGKPAISTGLATRYQLLIPGHPSAETESGVVPKRNQGQCRNGTSTGAEMEPAPSAETAPFKEQYKKKNSSKTRDGLVDLGVGNPMLDRILKEYSEDLLLQKVDAERTGPPASSLLLRNVPTASHA